MKSNTRSVLPRLLRGVFKALMMLCMPLGARLAFAQDAQLTKLADFDATTTGYSPQGSLVQGSDGAFYGVTTAGGANDSGTAFKMTVAGTLTKLADFNYSTTGNAPIGGLVQGSDGAFYGVAQYGGANGYGTAFKLTAAGVLTKLADFNYTTTGYAPKCRLVQGADGAFYGVTPQGGPTGYGTAFKLTMAGVLTRIADFNSSTTGSAPTGGLVQGSDGAFYGVARQGGSNGHGTAFRLTEQGSITSLGDFDFWYTGYGPQGSLVRGDDGILYGLTSDGGSYGHGTAFAVSEGGGLWKLADFESSTTGSHPTGGLVRASDGDFYGMTPEGGPVGNGTVFKLTADGQLTRIADFDSTTTGIKPKGNLIQVTDGAFYGLTSDGGANGHGTAFMVDAGIYNDPGPRILVMGADDGGSVSYGTLATGATSDRVFTIQNRGNSPLTGLSVSVDGVNASNYVVTASPAASIDTPGGTTTFTVRFSSATAGVRTANLHIASNDVDSTPYDITLTATAMQLNWQPQASNFQQIFNSVDFISSTTGWAVGYSGAVRKTTNGGATWTTQISNTNETLNGVSFADANTGWVCGYNGELRKTTNGGTTWSKQTPATAAHGWAIFALSPSLAWETGSSGMLGRTTNGVNWTGGEGLPSGNPGYSMVDIQFVDANNGWAVTGSGWSVRTTNGGASWTRMNIATNLQLRKLSFISATTGWAVGNNGIIIKTSDGGLTWAAQNSGTTAYLSGVSFVDANTGWVVGDGGTILRTTNGGTTWSVEFSNTTEFLADIDFMDAQHGWIVGDNGLILSYSPPPPPPNGAPTDIAISSTSIAENNASGAIVGTLSTSDPDSGDTFTYSFASGGMDNGSFTLAGGNTLRLTPSADFETKSSYAIRIRTTDGGGLFFEKDFTITVIDGNDAPTFAGYVVSTPFQKPVSISLGKLLAGATDREGDSFSVTSAGPASALGGMAVKQGGTILYTPANGFSGADTFPVTITDARGASVISTVTVNVQINTGIGGNTPVLTMMSGGRMGIGFQGIPGRAYEIQRSTNLNDWTTLTSITAASNGAIVFIDESPPPGSAFYRLRRP